jgi:hypothetical protein
LYGLCFATKKANEVQGNENRERPNVKHRDVHNDMSKMKENQKTLVPTYTIPLSSPIT